MIDVVLPFPQLRHALTVDVDRMTGNSKLFTDVFANQCFNKVLILKIDLQGQFIGLIPQKTKLLKLLLMVRVYQPSSVTVSRQLMEL